MRDASVVIPSLRGGPRLVALVETLAAAGAEVRIADNGLPAAAVTRLAGAGAVVVPMPGNVGFGRAVNSAATDATGRALVVLNDDIEPCAGFLESLLARLEDSAMVAGVLLRADSPGVVETAGIVIDRHLGAYDHLQGLPAAAVEESAPPPFGPVGAAAAFRREAFERVGGYDPGFFAYLEDVDLAIRLRLAGEQCSLAPAARALHVGSATLGYGSVRKAALVGASRGRLVRKYGLLRSPRTAAWVLATESAAALELARRHGSLAPARARVRGFRACRERAARPPAAVADVGLREGLRRRYSRSTRLAAA